MDNAMTRRRGAVDLYETDPYIDGFAERHASRARMSDRNDKSQQPSSALTVLEDKIDQLIALCAQLNRENQALKAENLNYQQERRDLIAKNELARARVEATLQRLRSMEAAS
jgi:cell division protein ZapB